MLHLHEGNPPKRDLLPIVMARELKSILEQRKDFEESTDLQRKWQADGDYLSGSSLK
jgi:hypothetical protein